MSHRPHQDQSAHNDPSTQEQDLWSSDGLQSDPLRGHNKRLSVMSAAPAYTHSPDVQVSLIQPGGALATPQAEEVRSAQELAAIMDTEQGKSVTQAPDYFSQAPVPSRLADQKDRGPSGSTTAQSALSRQSTRSSGTSSYNNPEHFRMASSYEQRWAYPQETMTTSPSWRSNSPIEGSLPDLPRSVPYQSMTEHPHYPNQALSALSSQVHPEPHYAPYASRPGLYRANKPTGVFSRISSPSNSGDERQPRTVGNTPIATPHLFSPHLPRYPALSSDDGESPIPSPYLHPVQPQVPKETNKATRDIDTSSGRKTINQYEILYEIGKGTHGKVKLARNMTTHEPVAIKIVQRYSKRRRLGKAQDQEDKVKKEIAILKKALHPNVVSMIEVIDDPDLHKIYLVLEFCEAHDVKWRDIGEPEIVMLENSRLAQEFKGEAAAASSIGPSDDRLMRAANRKLKRASRPPHAPLSRVHSESQFFSLEYGGESDPEEGGQHSPLATSSAGQKPDERTESGPTSRSIQVSESCASTPESTRPSHAPYPIQTGPDGAHRASPKAEYWNLQDFQEEMQRRVDQALKKREVSSKGRKVSVAESSSSMLTDAMDDLIEEEMRYVPLLTVAESRRAFRDALLGLEYLHWQGVIHRDIKPENLLRKADHSVKISDFGVSYLGKPIRDGRDSEETSDAETSEYHEEEADLAKTVGTPAFYAPELCSLDYSPDRPRVTAQIDVWALGVTLFCFLYARLPFQANNEFTMMRNIDKERPFISRKRLKAVDVHARSRPNSYGPLFRASKDHRLPHELLYDDIDDELYDLLYRLLIKDPTQRITLKQIKYHPWVLRDIPQPMKWIDETDPAKFTQKIEISHKDVHEAVAPLRFFKSVAKKFMGVLGPSSTSRKRGQSSAASSEASSNSPGLVPGGGSTSSQEHSRSEESIAAAMKVPRDQQYYHHQHTEHPLSQSVTASPELSTADKPFDWMEPMSPATEYNISHMYEYGRPRMPTRQESVMSTAGSVKTVTPSDYTPREHVRNRQTEVGTRARTIEPQSSQSFSHMLGEAGRTLLRSVRSRDKAGLEKQTPSNVSSPRSPEHHESLQGEPSVALSSTSAAGHLSTVRETPSRSGPQLKRHSLALTPKEMMGHEEPSSADMREALARRHLYHLEQTTSHGAVERIVQTTLSHDPSFLQLSPSSSGSRSRPSQPTISSNSSEDRFNSALSRETSFPSVPSVVSADSSIVPDVSADEPSGPFKQIQLEEPSKPRPASYHGAGRTSSGSTQPSRRPPIVKAASARKAAEDEHGVETDEDDSEEEFLVMNKTKSRPLATPKMSARTGSTNTVRKVEGREMLRNVDTGK